MLVDYAKFGDVYLTICSIVLVSIFTYGKRIENFCYIKTKTQLQIFAGPFSLKIISTKESIRQYTTQKKWNLVLLFNSHLTVKPETKLMTTHALRGFSASAQLRALAQGQLNPELIFRKRHKLIRLSKQTKTVKQSYQWPQICPELSCESSGTKQVPPDKQELGDDSNLNRIGRLHHRPLRFPS